MAAADPADPGAGTLTTRVAFDPVEMRWAARLLEATASQLRSNARSFERELGALGGVTPGMRGYVGDSLQSLASRTRAIADALQDDGMVLSAIASFIEAAEREGHLPDINLDFVEATYKAMELIGRHADELNLHPAAVATLLPPGATLWDEAFASLDLPALGKVAGGMGWVVDGVQYYFDSGGDWSETITRTLITGAAGVVGGAIGTAVCSGLGVAGGLPGLACFAVGGALFSWGGDKVGKGLTTPPTLDEVMDLTESVSHLPEPAQAQLMELLESGDYTVYEALRTIEMNFGHLDDPQIDDDPLADE